MTPGGGRLLLLLSGLLGNASAASAQLSADVYVGGTRYDALAPYAASTNIVGNLRYQAPRYSAYASAAAPIDGEATVWGAIGAALRPSVGLGRLRLGLELDGDAYLFRRSALAGGSGYSTHVLPVISVPAGGVLLELRGGTHDHWFRSDSGDYSRHVYELSARGSAGATERYAIAELRSLFGRSGRRFPMGRLQVGGAAGPLRVFVSAGRWFGDDLAATVWGVGASAATGPRGELWAGVRHDASDPLYLGPARTVWNVGYSLKLGRAADQLQAPVVRGGSLILRLPGGSGQAPSVAGEFSSWQPLPMRRSGGDWVIEIPIRPGVYRFAFVSATGDWYVPAGYPGRMSDDMGGHVALVVVP